MRLVDMFRENLKDCEQIPLIGDEKEEKWLLNSQIKGIWNQRECADPEGRSAERE